MQIKVDVEHFAAHKIYLSVISAFRSFLDQKGYREVEVPVLSPALIPESHLEVFQTEFRYFDQKDKLYLIPAQELFLKRLIAYGFGDCFTIGKTFRNHERPASLHANEFTMLEYYRINSNYLDMADEMLDLIRYSCRKSTGSDSLIYKGKETKFDKWEMMTVAEAFDKYAGIDSRSLFNEDLLISAASNKGYNTEGSGYSEVFSQIYGHEIEPKLGVNGRAVLLYDYPVEFAATAKLNKDGKTAARFDVYIGGIEIGNCYSELTDVKITEERFARQYKRRQELGKIDYPIDKGFIEAIKYGLTDCSGATIGVDRLAMLFAGVESVADLRPIVII